MRITVVGCGIVGLCSGIRLLEAGWPVAIVAREEPARTTSSLAGALWFPYRVGPEEKALAWGAVSYRILESLAGEPASGVSMTEFTWLSGERLAGEPWWAAGLPEGRVRPAEPGELPDGYRDGRVATASLMETPVYLRYLFDRFTELGGRFTADEVARLSDLASAGALVVNCAGLGARALGDDDSLYPVQGHVVYVRPPASARVRCLVDDSGPNALAYVLPRRDVCVLGGTAVENDSDTRVRPDVVEAILRRCARLAPELGSAEYVGAAAGLRPTRPEVRLETERLRSGATVIHNYGHGGGGFTLAWGCAEEVVGLARAL